MIIVVLLIIVGYLINDIVVVFDCVWENLIKYKKKLLIEVLNLLVNEMLVWILMILGIILLVLIVLLVLGGDVICGFVFVIMWGIFVGIYLLIYVVKNIVLMLGVKWDWFKDKKLIGN